MELAFPFRGFKAAGQVGAEPGSALPQGGTGFGGFGVGCDPFPCSMPKKRGFQPGAVTAEAYSVFLQEAVAAEKGLVLVCSAEKPAPLPQCPFVVELGN